MNLVRNQRAQSRRSVGSVSVTIVSIITNHQELNYEYCWRTDCIYLVNKVRALHQELMAIQTQHQKPVSSRLQT